MLRVAIPNKGTLAEPAAQMLREAGYRQRTDPKDLVCRDEANDVEFFYLRPKDIATYVGSGDLDLGITGRDLLIDSAAPAEEVLDLAFGRATFRFAARPDDIASVAGSGRPPDRHRVPRAGRAAPRPSSGVKADVIRLDGAVENAVRLGVADVIADVVETGATLRQAGLVVVRRAAAALVGGAGPPGRRAGERAGRAVAAPPAGRAGGPPLRDARLRRAGRPAGPRQRR